MIARSSRPLRITIATTLSAVIVMALAACTPSVALTPAADANNPLCAAVTVRLPSSIDGKNQDNTDAQATGAWGNPVAVQLKCGVSPLGPTTKPCVTVSGPDGSVDWVLESDPLAKELSYITFGRTPAVEVTIDHSSNGVSDSDTLNALTTAVSSIPRGPLKCLSLNDAPTPSATPAPTTAPAPSGTPNPANTPASSATPTAPGATTSGPQAGVVAG